MSPYDNFDKFNEFQIAKKGNYYMLCFNIANYIEISPYEKQDLQNKMFKLTIDIENIIKELESIEHKKILVNCYRSKTIITPIDYNPLLSNNGLSITIYKDSISKERIINIFCELLDKYEIDHKFCLVEGYYETNDEKKSDKKLYRGQLIKYLPQRNPYDEMILKKNHR